MDFKRKTEINVYYLHNSAAAVLFEESLLIFDHYLDEYKGLDAGSVSKDDLAAAARVYVFVSHSHPDHFSPGIFDWADVNPNTTYILDSTVPDRHRAGQCAVLKRGESYDDGYLHVREFGSTDEGGSFFVRCEGTSIFHAGDLNLWHWRDEGNERYSRAMEKYFEKEKNFLREQADEPDIAFFPVDSRLGSGYDEGADIFIRAMKPEVFIPIHFRSFGDTKKYSEKHFDGTLILSIEKRGQKLI